MTPSRRIMFHNSVSQATPLFGKLIGEGLTLKALLNQDTSFLLLD